MFKAANYTEYQPVYGSPFSPKNEQVMSGMPAKTPLNSNPYRQVISFLADYVDESFSREARVKLALTEAKTVDHGQLLLLRERRDAAYEALERVLELTLKDLNTKRSGIAVCEAEARSPSESAVLDQVFQCSKFGPHLRKKKEKYVSSTSGPAFLDGSVI